MVYVYLLSVLNRWPSLHILANFSVIEILSLAKLFNLSFQGGATGVFTSTATVHYLVASKMAYLLSNTPVTSLTALISDSRDTRSFATYIPNIVPRWINFH